MAERQPQRLQADHSASSSYPTPSTFSFRDSQTKKAAEAGDVFEQIDD
jgi:hypothetical protein